jgi:NAD(P)-dependent dehydrogenase (short-subunit alcohol dehydrogenase family)
VAISFGRNRTAAEESPAAPGGQGMTISANLPRPEGATALRATARMSGQTIADLDKLVPFGRIGKPEVAAALVAFLASDAAAFMRGPLVEITGAHAAT